MIPFAFIYNDVLLMWDGTTTVAFVGILAIVLSILGFGYGTDYSRPTRVAYAALGFGAIFSPDIAVQLAAVVLALHFAYASKLVTLSTMRRRMVNR